MKFVNRLTPQSITILSEMMRSHPNSLVRKKAHAIILSSKQYEIDQISKIFNEKPATIVDWIARWETFGLESLADRAERPEAQANEHNPLPLD